MSSPWESSSLNWKHWLQPRSLTFYFLALVLVVPTVVWQLQSHHISIHTKEVHFGGLCLVHPACVPLGHPEACCAPVEACPAEVHQDPLDGARLQPG